MSYDQPRTQAYHLGSINFVGTPAAQAIIGPKGKKGKIKDIHIHASVAFTATTTGAIVTIGTASDADAYASFSAPAIAITDSVSATNSDPTFLTKTGVTTSTLPVDTQIEIAFTAPTGGSPAGTGLVTVYIDWY